MLLLLTANTQASNLPDLGSSDLKEYDAQTEIRLGRAFSTALHQHYDLVKDPIVLSYIRRIGKKIIAETGESRAFSFHVINNKQINAFAGPNGVIDIHTGLIQAAKSEDELASVIAHEIAHVTLHHLSRRFEYQDNMSASSIATLIAAILIGTQNPEAGFATYLGGMGLTIQKQLKNSRIHEAEADYKGIKYLYKAGYNPHAMADFFTRLDKENQVYATQIPEILLTHPVTKNRLAKARDRANKFNLVNNSSRNETLKLIQLRLNHLSGNDLEQYKTSKLTADQQCYVMNLSSKKNFSCLSKAIKNTPKERIYRIQKANILSYSAPLKSALEFKYLLELYPSDFSIPYFYSHALVKNNKIQQAIEMLTEMTPNFLYQNTLYSRLSLLYASINNENKSYYYDALASFNIGNIKKSLHLIKLSKKLEKNKKTSFYNKLTLLEQKLTNIKQAEKPL